MAEPIIISTGLQSDTRRVKVLAGVGAAVLFVLVVVPRVFGGDDGGAKIEEVPATATASPTTVAPAVAVPETFEGFTSKNPFKPLVDLTSSPGGGGGDVTSSEPLPVTNPDDFLQPPATIPGDGSVGFPVVDPGTTPGSVPPAQLDRVGLLEIYTDLAAQPVGSVRVNDVTYQVMRGDRFADSYQVISLDVASRCGDFLFGDDRFRLCEGDEVQK